MGILDRYSEEIDAAKKYIKFGAIILVALLFFGGVVKKGLCPCGSGKKYEKCCLKKEREI